MRTRFSPLSLALAALLIVHAAVITAALHYVFGVPRAGTLAHHADVLVRGTPGGDSWKPMATARQFAADNPGASIYDEVFFQRGMKFQYPPSALLFTDSLERRTLHLMSWLALWLTVLLSVYLFEQSLRAAGYLPVSREDSALRILAASGLALTFYPLLKAYSLGQIQVWIDCLFAALVVAWSPAPRLSGACLGIICLIKPHLALIGLWAATRRRWRFVGAFVAVVVVGLAISVLLFGLTSHRDYVQVLRYISERGEAFYANQSVNGLLNRFLFNGRNLEWQETAFAPPSTIVQIGTVATGLLLTAVALVFPRGRSRGGLLDLAIVSLVATMASPVAWEHHYGVLLPLFGATAGPILGQRPFGRVTLVAFAAAFVVIGQFFQPLQLLAASRWNVLQSYLLFAALALLGMWLAAAVQSSKASRPQVQQEKSRRGG